MSLAEAPDVLTVPELACLLRIGRNEAYRLVDKGEIHARRIGRSIRIPKIGVEAYLEGRPQPGSRPELKVI